MTRHAFVMDPWTQVKAHKDTSYFLMLAAAKAGHEVCSLQASAMRLDGNRLCAQVDWLEVCDLRDKPFRLIAQADCDLGEMNAVWIRTDPPFDRRYLYATLLCDHLPPTTRVFNRPSGIRNWNEKLAALHYPEFSPKTLISNEQSRIEAFSREVGRVAIKPVDGYGGKGIFFYDAQQNDRQADSQAAKLTDAVANGKWQVVQQYLAAAKTGDKRILLLNGEPLGAILRVHAADSELNNLDAGGTAHPAELTAHDKKICAALKPELIAQGIFFAGIDVIGDKLIEINVTSPTGLQELCRFSGRDFHRDIIAAASN